MINKIRVPLTNIFKSNTIQNETQPLYSYHRYPEL